MIQGSFGERFKIVQAQAMSETGMTGTEYPASGSFIDVSGFEWVHIVVHLGTLNGGASPVLEPKSHTAATGSPSRINAALVHTCNVTTDDGKMVVWSIEVRRLAEGHRFVCLGITGTLTSSYMDPVFYLERSAEPVTQPAGVSAVYNWLG